MNLDDNKGLIELALRSHIKEIDRKLANLPSNASDEFFCSLAYEAMDAEELANRLKSQRLNPGREVL
jgi:hypothetical protein